MATSSGISRASAGGLLARQLAPEEEELVEAVMQRPDAELDANPFDLHTALVEPWEALTGPAAAAAAAGATDGGSSSADAGGAAGAAASAAQPGVPVALALALIDEKLAQYALEHPWGQELVAQ